MHEDNSLCDGIALLAEGRIKGKGDILKMAFTLNLSLSFIEYYMKRQKIIIKKINRKNPI